jgi:transposase
MAHAIEIRTRAIELLNKGYTQKFVSEILNVGTTAIKRWKSQIEKFGSINVFYDASNRVAPKLTAKELKEYFKSNGDSLLKEAAEHFKCTPQAVFYACKRNGITYKKKSRTTKSVTNKNVRNSKKQ